MKKSMKKIGPMRRKAVPTDREQLVSMRPLRDGEALPLLVEPQVEGVSLRQWAADNADTLRRKLLHHGGILFRGFDVGSVDRFEELSEVLSGDLMDYTYRSTPRREVSGRVYTSTEYPADQSIPMHNEMSYSRQWPLRIAFFCAVAADEGGATPIADSRRVYQEIDPEVREKFAERGVLYVRNYSPDLDIPWQEVFQTDDKAGVERFCEREGIEIEWREGGALRTRQVCQGVASHPETGEDVWFNQAHLFHVSRLDPDLARTLIAERGEEGLPRNTYYGDGTPIEPEALAEIERVYGELSLPVDWQPGDLVLLDNMLAAHGRHPFAGQRRILVSMAGSYRADATAEVGS